jgi:hypothetical protein
MQVRTHAPARSANDPKIAGSAWLPLWAKQFGAYPVIGMSHPSNGFNCGNSVIGGHVIAGQKAMIKYNGIWLKNYMGT